MYELILIFGCLAVLAACWHTERRGLVFAQAEGPLTRKEYLFAAFRVVACLFACLVFLLTFFPVFGKNLFWLRVCELAVSLAFLPVFRGKCSWLTLTSVFGLSAGGAIGLISLIEFIVSHPERRYPVRNPFFFTVGVISFFACLALFGLWIYGRTRRRSFSALVWELGLLTAAFPFFLLMWSALIRWGETLVH